MQFSTTWSDAIRRKEFGMIADWFISYFFGVGLFALVLAGIAAGAGGTPFPNSAPAASHPTAQHPPSVTGQTQTTHQQPPKQRTGSQQPQRRPPQKHLPSKQSPANHGAAAALPDMQQSLPTDASRGFRVFALGLLLAGACTGVGWLFGLLFGVPRSLAQPATATPAANGASGSAGASAGQPATSRVNTNLEEISDWLTKTLVGVGLTQLAFLPKGLGDLARDINAYGFDWGTNGHLLALGLILYFVPGGFWLGYVGTRTFLTGLFDLIDSRVSPQDISLAADALNLRLTDCGIEDPQGRLKTIDDKLLRLPVQALNSNKEVLAWAAAQARAKNYDVARMATENALKIDPDNPDIKLQLALIRLAMRRPDNAAALMADSPDRPAKVFAALYEPPPDGFRKAIELGEKLEQDNNYKDVASLHVWLACAYGQQYGYESARQAAPDALKAIHDKAVAEIQTAIRLEPAMRERLLDYWKPAPGALDDDLASFPQNDPELTALLVAPPAGPG